MKDLAESFDGRGETKGFHFNLLHKSGRGYLYEVRTTPTSHHYEVFERRENERYGCVTYPSSKVFGRYAWTYKTIERAMAEFGKL